jgi:fumarate reductase subunit C
MARRPSVAVVPSTTAKCTECGRMFDTKETAERLAHWADNPLVIKLVIRKLAVELHTTQIWLKICPEDASRRVDMVLEENSSQRDILTDDEERYGYVD